MTRVCLIVLLLLTDSPLSATSVWHAAQKKNLNAFIAALENHPHDIVRKDGTTVLMYCAQFNFVDGLVYLLNKGENPNRQNSKGKTALHFALRKKYKSATFALLMYDASTVIKDSDGKAPIKIVATKFYPSKIKKLVRKAFYAEKLSEQAFSLERKNKCERSTIADPALLSPIENCESCLAPLANRHEKFFNLCDRCKDVYRVSTLKNYHDKMITLPCQNSGNVTLAHLRELDFCPAEIVDFKFWQAKVKVAQFEEWRSCPNAKCQFGVDISELAQRYFNCECCNYKGCICGLTHANNLKCEDAANIGAGYKHCPGCNILTQRTSSSQRITCPTCETNWQFDTGKIETGSIRLTPTNHAKDKWRSIATADPYDISLPKWPSQKFSISETESNATSIYY